MSPEGSEIPKLLPSTRVTSPEPPPSTALVELLHGSDTGPKVALVPTQPSGPSAWRPRSVDRAHRAGRAPLVSDPPARLRRDRAHRRDAGRGPDETGTRGDPLRIRRLTHRRRRSRVDADRSPRPGLA